MFVHIALERLPLSSNQQTKKGLAADSKLDNPNDVVTTF